MPQGNSIKPNSLNIKL